MEPQGYELAARATTEQREVPTVASRIDRLAEELEADTKELEARLRALVRPDDMDAVDRQSIPREALYSSHAQNLDEIATKLFVTQRRIRGLLDRLEV